MATESTERRVWRAGFIGAMNAVGMVLGARLVVLVSVCGAIGLTYIALQNPNQYQLIALGIYVAGAIPATVWLAGR